MPSGVRRRPRLGDQRLEAGFAPARDHGHGAARLRDDAARDRAEEHGSHGAVAARTADEQVEVLRQPDEHVYGVADPALDLGRDLALPVELRQRLLRRPSSRELMLADDVLDALAGTAGSVRVRLEGGSDAVLDHRDDAQARMRAPRESERSAQSLATVLGVTEGDADRLRELMALPAVRSHRNRTRRPGQQPRSG